MFLAVVIGLLAISFLLRLWWKNSIYGKASDALKGYPGPPATPFFGNVLQLKSSSFPELLRQFNDWYAEYGSPMKINFGPFASVYLFEKEHVEALMKSTKNISKSRDYDMIVAWLGNGLLTSTGERWFRKRKLLTPAFHFEILKDFVPVFNEHADSLMKLLKTCSDNSQEFNVCRLFTLCTLDVICETAMGKQLNALTNANSDYVNAIMEISEILIRRMMKPWFWPDFTFYNLSSEGRLAKRYLNILHEFTWNVIKERESLRCAKNESLEEPEETFGKKRKRLAFLDLLLEMKEKGEMDLEEVREEVDTFMFEGHDTTATGLMWTCYCLGRNKEIQKKVQEELDSILGDDLCVWPTPQQLQEMKYLECCIKESQRLYPPVPVIARKIEEPLKIDEKHTLPVGVVAIVNMFQLHRDKQNFTDPLTYNPDRFLLEVAGQNHPFAFVPFSAGPRNCIGQKFAMMELKVVLCHFLRTFSVEAIEPEESIDPAYLLILRPTKGIYLRLKTRS